MNYRELAQYVGPAVFGGSFRPDPAELPYSLATGPRPVFP